MKVRQPLFFFKKKNKNQYFMKEEIKKEILKILDLYKI